VVKLRFAVLKSSLGERQAMSILIDIPDSLRPFVEGQVSRGGFKDAAEYLISLAEIDRLHDVRADLELKLLEAAKSPSELATPEFWAQLRASALKNIRAQAAH